MLGSRFLQQIVRYRTVSSTFRGATVTALKAKSRLYSTVPQTEKRSLVKAVTDDKSITLHWEDGGNIRLHHVWLRHHCPCHACLDPKTRQRTIDMALISAGVQPQEVNIALNDVVITWEDGHQSSFKAAWLRDNAYGDFTKGQVKRGFGSIANEDDMLLWNNEIVTKNPPPEYKFHDLQNNDDLIEESLNSLFRYGFFFVNETPTDKESLAKICKLIGGVVQNNLYGHVYVLENKVLTKSDLAFLSHALHGHTDHVYFCEPAGIQAMHCRYHHGTGGDSLLVDGFFAAKTLYKENPEAYKILTSTEVPFEYNSEEHCIRVHGPLIELDPFTQELKQLRYNNSRVGPFINMNLTFEEMEEFYNAVRMFGSILRRPENELWFRLSPGRVIVMDNRRTLHGRSAITGSRSLMGSYVGMDDYMGRWRANKMKRM